MPLLLAMLLPATALAGSAPDPILSDVTREEPVFFLLEPDQFQTGDYTIDWNGEALSGVSASLEPGSLQWVRVDSDEGVLRLPRARILVTASDAEAASVSEAGHVQALAPEASGTLRAKMLIALVSGDPNPITVRLARGGVQLEGEMRVRFHPRSPSAAGRIYLDVTCSAF